MDLIVRRVAVATTCAVFAMSGCQRDEPAAIDAEMPEAAEEAAPTAWIDGERIGAADAEPGNWLSHGRTWSEQRYSPLDQIDTSNVTDLGLAWYVDLDTNRGQEATPIVVDGVLYSTSAWSKIQAVDAKTAGCSGSTTLRFPASGTCAPAVVCRTAARQSGKGGSMPGRSTVA